MQTRKNFRYQPYLLVSSLILIGYFIGYLNLQSFIKQWMPEGEGAVILFYVMIPFLITGGVFFIFFISEWTRSAKSIYDFENIMSTIQDTHNINLNKTYSNLETAFNTDKKKTIISEIVTELKINREKKLINITATSIIDGCIERYSARFESYGKWMMFFCNTMLILGLLGSFIGINRSVESLDLKKFLNNNSIQEVNLKSNTTESEAPLQKMGAWNIQKGKLTKEMEDGIEDKQQTEILLKMDEVLTGLSIIFRCSIWGIIFMLMLSLLLTQSQSMHLKLVRYIDEISKKHLIPLYNIDFLAIQSITEKMIETSEKLLSFQDSIRSVEKSANKFESAGEKIQNQLVEFSTGIKKYNSEINNTKDNIGKLSDNFKLSMQDILNHFKIKLENLHSENNFILKKFTDNLGNFKSTLELTSDNNQTLSNELKKLNANSPILISSMGDFQQSSSSLVKTTSMLVEMLTNMQSETKEVILQSKQIRESIDLMVRKSQKIPEMINDNENKMVNLFSNQFNRFSLKMDEYIRQSVNSSFDILSALKQHSEDFQELNNTLRDSQDDMMKDYRDQTNQMLEKLFEIQIEKLKNMVSLIEMSNGNLGSIMAKLDNEHQNLQNILDLLERIE